MKIRLTLMFAGSFLLLPVTLLAEQFTIAVIPDTQTYAAENSRIFNTQASWIVNNNNQPNNTPVIFVAHLGDLKDNITPSRNGSCGNITYTPPLSNPPNANKTTAADEWSYVAAALSTLDAAGIAYGVLPGNHDFDQIVRGNGDEECPSWNMDGTDGGRPLTEYAQTLNSYYADSDIVVRPPAGAAVESNQTFTGDSYTLFSSSGGIEFIAINLGFREFVAPAGNPGITWANQLLAANPNRIGIVTAHFLLETNEVGDTSPNEFSPWGARFYDEIRGNKNLFMMLSAHRFGEAWRVEPRTSTGMAPVHVLLSNYQRVEFPPSNTTFSNLNGDLATGDSGFMRTMEFDTDTGLVSIKSFIPAGTGALGVDWASIYSPFGAVVNNCVVGPADIATINNSSELNTNTAANLTIPFIGYVDGFLTCPSQRPLAPTNLSVN